MSMINAALVAYMAASIAYIVKEIWQHWTLRYYATGIFAAGFVLNGIIVIRRWIESGHAPFANLYESLIFYALCIALVYLFLEAIYKIRIVGALASVMALLVIAYASLQDTTIKPLMPALQSNWLTVHVVTYFIGYAAFGISFITSIVFLVVRLFANKQATTNPETADTSIGTPRTFDKLSYQIVALGFPFLTLGLITGAVWAKSAWGDYWSWDPKETWSLITWLVYLIYLHLPLVLPRMKNLNKAKIPIIQSVCLLIAFGIVAFTYLGMHYLPSASESDHIYGAK
ncbi:MAG: c-type cytochrome biogenesis protein CcsB [Candidatus Brocadiales bacterium]